MPKLRFPHQHALQILQLIRAQGSIARSEVAEKTGDSTFLISKICDELLEQEFISEVGRGDSTGGRRPTLLSLKPGPRPADWCTHGYREFTHRDDRL